MHETAAAILSGDADVRTRYFRFLEFRYIIIDIIRPGPGLAAFRNFQACAHSKYQKCRNETSELTGIEKVVKVGMCEACGRGQEAAGFI